MEASAGRCTGTEQPLSPRAAACRPLAAVQGSVSSSSSAVQLALSPLLLQQQLAAVQGSVSSSSPSAVVTLGIGDLASLAVCTSASDVLADNAVRDRAVIGTIETVVPAHLAARGSQVFGTSEVNRDSAPSTVGADERCGSVPLSPPSPPTADRRDEPLGTDPA